MDITPPRPGPALEALRRAAAAGRLPLHAQLELTHRCNLRCAHCYLGEWRDTDGAGELTTDEWIGVLTQLAALQTLFLSVTGGEPLLRPDAPVLLREARARGFVTSLLTNGTLLTESLARRLAAAGLFQAHVSLLGPEPEHDRLAGAPGAFARAVTGMALLRAAGVRVTAKLVLTRPALSRYAALLAFARTRADAVVVSLDLVPALDRQPLAEALRIDEADLSALPAPPRAPECGDPARSPDAPLCNAGASLLAIAPGGDVFPCLMLRRSGGNVRTRPLRAIWADEALVSVSSLRRGDLPACADCADAAYCSYCPARGWMAHGDPTRPEATLCRRAALFRNACGKGADGSAP